MEEYAGEELIREHGEGELINYLVWGENPKGYLTNIRENIFPISWNREISDLIE